MPKSKRELEKEAKKEYKHFLDTVKNIMDEALFDLLGRENGFVINDININELIGGDPSRFKEILYINYAHITQLLRMPEFQYTHEHLANNFINRFINDRVNYILVIWCPIVANLDFRELTPKDPSRQQGYTVIINNCVNLKTINLNSSIVKLSIEMCGALHQIGATPYYDLEIERHAVNIQALKLENCSSHIYLPRIMPSLEFFELNIADNVDNWPLSLRLIKFLYTPEPDPDEPNAQMEPTDRIEDYFGYREQILNSGDLGPTDIRYLETGETPRYKDKHRRERRDDDTLLSRLFGSLSFSEPSSPLRSSRRSSRKSSRKKR